MVRYGYYSGTMLLHRTIKMRTQRQDLGNSVYKLEYGPERYKEADGPSCYS